ncbi:hypothetical protein Daesc_003518 [Daldinia eschscholtzii]|uniref:Uncharacterized protein n=1 Tax=Daldinia eschscholtzii TaxID=292717 RepID=A0AAX6MTX0_9PEZI
MEKLGESANLSKERAMNDFLLFLPGVSTSLLVFIVFGTTRTFRKKICEKFIPNMFRRKPIEMPAAHTATPREDFHADEEDGMGFYNPQKQGPSIPALKTRSEEATTTAESSEPSVFTNSADTCCGLR